MGALAWVPHDRFKEFKGDNTIDMDNSVFEMRLYTVASNIATTSVGDATTATNELSGNGYAAQPLTPTWSRSGGDVTFDVNDPAFDAAGGPITGHYAAIVCTSTTPDEVCCHALLDDTPDDVTVTDTNTLTLNMNANGVFVES
ncbi:MAG: hypothetical protein JKY52_20030 [Flavobacteriales bacterium]|nr:hypothetical protein [Flavobacteriales bacterium]